MTKKEKGEADLKRISIMDVSSNKEEKKENVPALDESSIRERIEKAGQVFKKFSSLLTKQQEVLLQKLIYNDSMQIDTAVEGDTMMMQQLYNLFFAWKTEQDEKIDQEAAQQADNLTEE